MHGTKILNLARGATAAVAVTIIAGVGILTTVLPRLTGSVSLTVLSGSMSPAIPVGSLVLTKPVNPAHLRPGDVITYQARPGVATFITHRVVEVHHDGDNLSFITKGDANRGADLEPVPAGAMRGRVWFHVPYLGRLADTVRTPTGIVALIALSAFLYFAVPRRLIISLRARRRGAAAEPTQSGVATHA